MKVHSVEIWASDCFLEQVKRESQMWNSIALLWHLHGGGRVDRGAVHDMLEVILRFSYLRNQYLKKIIPTVGSRETLHGYFHLKRVSSQNLMKNAGTRLVLEIIRLKRVQFARIVYRLIFNWIAEKIVAEASM